jgi:ATP-dependent protease HslVU (ClpYQ) peptidase subunit
MSTMAVIRKNGLALIASDSLTNSGNLKISSRYKRNYHKIHKAGSSWVGLIGSATHHLVFRSIVRKYGKDLQFDSADRVFETLLFIHAKLREEYFLNPDESSDQEYESSQLSGLIAGPHGIFEFQSRREVVEYNRFWAIGSGQDMALGAMHAVYERLGKAQEIVRAGLAAACEFDDASGMPMIMHAVKLA